MRAERERSPHTALAATGNGSESTLSSTNRRHIPLLRRDPISAVCSTCMETRRNGVTITGAIMGRAAIATPQGHPTKIPLTPQSCEMRVSSVAAPTPVPPRTAVRRAVTPITFRPTGHSPGFGYACLFLTTSCRRTSLRKAPQTASRLTTGLLSIKRRNRPGRCSIAALLNNDEPTRGSGVSSSDEHWCKGGNPLGIVLSVYRVAIMCGQ